MPERDPNEKTLEQVEKATESEPTKSKDLLKSEDLKRKLGDSKKRITDDNTSRPTSQRDSNKDALEQVEKATDSEPVKGEGASRIGGVEAETPRVSSKNDAR